VRIAGTPGSSNRSVFLNDTSTTTLVSAKKTFTAQSGIVDAEFKFMQPTLVNNTKVFRLLSGSTAAVSIETIGGALQYRGPNSVCQHPQRVCGQPLVLIASSRIRQRHRRCHINSVRKSRRSVLPVDLDRRFDSFINERRLALPR
jgi:hypothetical protein